MQGSSVSAAPHEILPWRTGKRRLLPVCNELTDVTVSLFTHVPHGLHRHWLEDVHPSCCAHAEAANRRDKSSQKRLFSALYQQLLQRSPRGTHGPKASGMRTCTSDFPTSSSVRVARGHPAPHRPPRTGAPPSTGISENTHWVAQVPVSRLKATRQNPAV